MNSYECGFGRYLLKSIEDGVESCLASIGKCVWLVEMVLLAKLLPIVLLTFWQYEHNLHLGIVLQETVDGAHQYRQSLDWKELLWNVASHSESLSPCYYDY